MTGAAADRRRSGRPPRLPAHLVPIHVSPERPPRPLTREEAAAALGLHPRTVDRWARRGRLRLIDLGGTVRVPADEATRLRNTGPWTRFE
ncbi:MAG: Helix-turn-helix domain [Solirubrobacterales bacterium]|nr:Helix-turn-helix domain [Solirubrobacterales bacterium]